MALIALTILGFLAGFYIWRRRQRKKRVEALVREVALAHLSGDTARMDQASAGLKGLGITLVGVEEMSYDE